MKFWIWLLCLCIVGCGKPAQETLEAQTTDSVAVVESVNRIVEERNKVEVVLPPTYSREFPDLSNGRLVSVQNQGFHQVVLWEMPDSINAMTVYCGRHMLKLGWVQKEIKNNGTVKQYVYQKKDEEVIISFIPDTEGVMVEFMYENI